MQDAGQVPKRNHVGTVRRRGLRAGMCFEEKSVDSDRNRGPGESRCEGPIPARGLPETAGTLDGMGGIKNDRVPLLTHPDQASHIDHQIVVPEGSAPLGDPIFLAAA